MKTKTIRNYLFVLIPMLALALFSCKHDTKGTYTGSDKQPLNITIAQNEMIKFTKTSSSNRTIVAEPFVANENLKFYLWGTAQSGQTLAPKNVTVTSEDGIVGKVILDIDCYNWSLTLAACTASDLPAANPTGAQVLEKAVLVGYGNVDMMFTNSIKFTLTPKGLSKTGNVDLTLQLATSGDPATAWTIPEGYVAKAYIYDITTGAEIASGLSETVITNSDFNYTANDADIAPGTYSFQIEFTKTGENRKYVWNDTLIILPGKTAQETITIPNLVGTKPAAPEDFTVIFNKYHDGTQLQDETEESKYPGFYTAHFSWDGSGVNTEMNFAMEIAELTDDAVVDAAITDAAGFEALWGTSATYKEYTFDYLNDIRGNQRFYKGGSLFANNTWVDLYLELGKRYIARLYSENNAGYSDDASYVVIDCEEPDEDLLTINRFRVKYWNQGGIWNEGETKGEENVRAGYNLPRIEYWSQSETAYTVLNPLKAESPAVNNHASPYLYSGAADWIYWVTSLTSGTKYPYTANTTTPAPYTNFKNLDLYAVYARQGDFEIYNDKDYDILASYVAAFGITSPTKTGDNSVSKTALGFNLQTSPEATTTVTLTLPSDGTDTWIYDKVSFEISYSGVTYFNETQPGEARGTANTFTIPLKQLPTGYIYNCKLTAQYQMTTISYPFWITLTD